MLTLMGYKNTTVQAGKPMTVKGEAALPQEIEAGFAPLCFFFSQISPGGVAKARFSNGGAGAPFGGLIHA